MANLQLTLIRADGTVLAQSAARDEVNLAYNGEYQSGDKILLETDEVNALYHVRFDEANGSSLVYLTGNVEYTLPLDEMRVSPTAFTGEQHILSVKKAFPEETQNYRNLAENFWDQADAQNCYPHASANVTLGRPLFAPQSVIDGLTFTEKHAPWPYSSWSICRREDATWKLEFGRPVETDKLIVYTRADFPHDCWWTAMTVTFSDGTKETFPLTKTGGAQIFSVRKTIEWLEISDLIKADDPSPFPALTQVQVYGRG